MSVTLELLHDAVGTLGVKVGKDDRPGFQGAFEFIVTLLAGALVGGKAGLLAEIRPEIEKLYARTRIKEDLSERDDSLVGQLRALTTLCTVGSVQQLPEPDIRIAERYKDIIQILWESPEPLDNQQIADKCNKAEATVARALPELRAAGFVDSTRLWRRRMNSLTKDGKAALRKAKLFSAKVGAGESRTKSVAKLIARDFHPVLINDPVDTRYSFSHPKPVDILEKAKELGFRVEKAARLGFDVEIKEPSSSRDLPKITVGSDRISPHHRFEIAKVLVKYLTKFEHVVISDPRKDHVTRRMAAALLVPEFALVAAAEKTSDKRVLAREFEVSEQMMEHRLRELGIFRDGQTSAGAGAH